MSLQLRRALLGALSLLVAGCAGASRGSLRSPYSNVITHAELEEVGTRNLYDAVRRLRPRWLEVRRGMRSFNLETEVVVFEEESFVGNQDVLESMGTDGVWELRYLDGTTAQSTLMGIGDRHVEGAIIIYRTPYDRSDGVVGTRSHSTGSAHFRPFWAATPARSAP